LKEGPFWDQAGKYSASYIRAVGDNARQPVAALLDDLFLQASERKDASRFFHGKGFIGICEYRLKLARLVSVITLFRLCHGRFNPPFIQTKSRSEIDRFKSMLENASKNLEADSQDDDVHKSADLKVVRLCTMVSDYSSILENLHSDPQGPFSEVVVGIF
jgi:hypothetical protein